MTSNSIYIVNKKEEKIERVIEVINNPFNIFSCISCLDESNFFVSSDNCIYEFNMNNMHLFYEFESNVMIKAMSIIDIITLSVIYESNDLIYLSLFIVNTKRCIFKMKIDISDRYRIVPSDEKMFICTDDKVFYFDYRKIINIITKVVDIVISILNLLL